MEIAHCKEMLPHHHEIINGKVFTRKGTMMDKDYENEDEWAKIKTEVDVLAYEPQSRTDFVPSDSDLAALLLQRTTGLDIAGEHGAETPTRFAAMLRDMSTREEFKFTTFDNVEGVDEMITIMDIPFYTLCNHHVIPFYGKAHIAYIPNKSIAGLSKFGRAVKNIAKGLWVQELLTKDIADFLEGKLDPLGVAVVLQAEHMCMTMRGVQMPGTQTVTSAMRGVFADHDRTAKAEFMALIGSRI
jgi:GTP cyclohydrolase I